MHPLPPDAGSAEVQTGQSVPDRIGSTPWHTVAMVVGVLVVIAAGLLAVTDWVSGLVVLERGLVLVSLFACAGYLHQLVGRGTSI